MLLKGRQASLSLAANEARLGRKHEGLSSSTCRAAESGPSQSRAEAIAKGHAQLLGMQAAEDEMCLRSRRKRYCLLWLPAKRVSVPEPGISGRQRDRHGDGRETEQICGQSRDGVDHLRPEHTSITQTFGASIHYFGAYRTAGNPQI